MLNVTPEKLDAAVKRAEEIIKGLTLAEKSGQLSQFGTSIYNDEVHYFEDHYEKGTIGSYLTVGGAKVTNRLQKECKEKFPTHIPILFADDVIHGYKTIFPTPLAQSASWEPEAAKKGAEVAAKEASSAGIRWTFSPMVDIARDPRWGRIVEGYGEDTYLCSKFSEAVVKGYQGEEIGEKDKVLACMKHFIGYGACVGGRDYDAVDMSLNTLYDVYLPPFKAGIDAGAATVMSAFHTFNGVPCTGNKFLLKDLLRGMLKFDGFVISDAGSVWEMKTHGFVENLYDSSKEALKAGLSILMAGDQFNDHIPELIKNGDITEEQIDKALLPVITLKILLGVFEDPFVDPKGEECFFCDEHRAASREMAVKCPVMLENKGSLPLDISKKYALIGPLVDDKENVLGPWALKKEIETTVTIKEGFKNAGINFSYAKGSDFLENNEQDIADAVECAKNCDTVILVLGEKEEMSGEAKSRVHLRIPDAQIELFNKVAEVGKPIILLISAGRPIIVEEFKDRCDSIVYIWQLGTETGNALADLLLGKHDMSGRLTASVPYHEGQLPVYYNKNHTGRPALGKVWYETGYKDMTTDAAYTFGYGLSYTEFEYSDLTLSATEMKKDGSIEVCCKIKNVGKRGGYTVAQLYIRDLVASCVRPIKELKGFEKLYLEAGQERVVKFTLNADDLAFHNQKLERVVEPGKFNLWVAKDSADNTLKAEFSVVE